MEGKNAISAAIENWAKYIVSSKKIYRAYGLKGGWESWAQKTTDDGQGNTWQNDVTRENYVYEPFVSPTTGKKVEKKDDILITTNKYNKFSKQTFRQWTNIIELKCQSSGNAGNFVTDVKGDMDKIQLNAIKKEFLPTYAWVLVISVGLDSHAELEKLAATRNAEILKKKKEQAGAAADPRWDDWVASAKFGKFPLGDPNDQIFLWGWRMDLAPDAKTFYWYW